MAIKAPNRFPPPPIPPFAFIEEDWKRQCPRVSQKHLKRRPIQNVFFILKTHRIVNLLKTQRASMQFDATDPAIDNSENPTESNRKANS
jgi:hypothetical protein